jgi:hypothetical protein
MSIERYVRRCNGDSPAKASALRVETVGSPLSSAKLSSNHQYFAKTLDSQKVRASLQRRLSGESSQRYVWKQWALSTL